MSGLQLTPDQYLTVVKMSEESRLLLEGSDDCEFFTLLYNKIQEFYKRTSPCKIIMLKKIKIQTAEEIKAPLGNKDKVEHICNLALHPENQDIKHKILGFVDREFREFYDFSTILKDRLKTHKMDNCLIWTRGHSIENYLFEISVWKETFFGYPTSRYYQDSFSLFESKFDDILKLSCALSLAAWSEDLISLVAKTLNWSFIEIKSNSIQIDFTSWKSVLKKQKLDTGKIDNLVNKINQYLDVASNSNLDVIRWLTHGHIGLNLMFAVYGKCLYQIALSDGGVDPNQEAEKINSHKARRFTEAAKNWSAQIMQEMEAENISEFPIKCFDLLIENMTT